MNYPLYIARRIGLGGGGRKSSPGVKVAITAIALSVAVMTASIAIVMGFKREITDKVVGFTSHITVSAADDGSGDNVVTLTPTLKKILDSQRYISDYSVQASLPVILKTPSDFKGMFLKNLDDANTEKFLSRNLISGRIPDFSVDSARNQVVLSRTAATQMGLNTGDKVDCYFINDEVKVRRLEIKGIYDSHFDAYDNLMMYGSRSLVDALCGLKPNQGTSLLVTTKDFNKVDEETEALRNVLAEALADGTIYKAYRVENAHASGANFFHWLGMLDTNVAVILALMMIVGCVTLISGMLTIILDKKRFIGLMKALGMRTGKLRKVFMYLALKVAVTGMVIGNAVVIAGLWLQDHTHLLKLDASSYYIDFVPVELDWEAFALLNACVIIIVWIVLIFPSRIIAKISPAETMREE